ncbi:MAG: alpha/beta fold hydrolase [Patescibacteria group bacterium]
MNENLDNLASPLEEKVEIKSVELNLEGRLFLPAQILDKNPGTLFIHGWKSRQEKDFELARQLAEDGSVALTFELRGHGDSGVEADSFSREEFLSDALAAYDFLASDSRIDKEKISVISSSFGGYLSALLSADRKVQNLVLRAPANYPDLGFDTPRSLDDMNAISDWRRRNISWNETKSLEALFGFKGKVMIVESGKDETVPHETIQNYIDAIEDKDHLTHIVMEDAGHSISQNEEASKEYRSKVRKWLKDNNV